MYKLAVLGIPINHSKSPQLQQSLARGCGISIEYERIETDKTSLYTTIMSLKNKGYNGFNCTMPLKTDMAIYADTITNDVRALCSANTVKIAQNKLYASTTDGMGMIKAIEHNNYEVKNKRVLLLGSGGASRSIALSLINYGVSKLIILNRTLSSAISLSQMLNSDIVKYDIMNTQNLNLYAEQSDIVINGTSLGMTSFDEHESFSFLKLLPKSSIIADAVYNPLETQLLKNAKSNGIYTINGLWMLLFQGVLAFHIWTGYMPDIDIINKTYEIMTL